MNFQQEKQWDVRITPREVVEVVVRFHICILVSRFSQISSNFVFAASKTAIIIVGYILLFLLYVLLQLPLLDFFQVVLREVEVVATEGHQEVVVVVVFVGHLEVEEEV